MFQPAIMKPARPMAVTLTVVIMGLIPLLSLSDAIVGLAGTNQTVEEFRRLAEFEPIDPANADPDQVAGNLAVRALPDWAAGVLLGSSGLSVLGYIATAILLALPSAHVFFRGHRPARWTPPPYPRENNRTTRRLPRIRLTPPTPGHHSEVIP